MAAAADEELKYTASLPCFETAAALLDGTGSTESSSGITRPSSAEPKDEYTVSQPPSRGRRRCDVCDTMVREGPQWEEHLKGRRHEMAKARATAAERARVAIAAQKKNDLLQALLSAKAKVKARAVKPAASCVRG
jgi:hypothetical protein